MAEDYVISYVTSRGIHFPQGQSADWVACEKKNSVFNWLRDCLSFQTLKRHMVRAAVEHEYTVE